MKSCISYKQIIIFTLLVAMTCSDFILNGQESIGVINDALKKSISIALNPPYKSAQNVINGLDYKLPLLEKVELRTQTERLSLARQEFLIRTSFNTLAHRNAILAERKAFLLLDDIENISEVRNKIYTTYKSLIELSSSIKKNQTQVETEQHYETHITLFEKLMAAGEAVDLGDYIKLKKEILFIAAHVNEDTQKILKLKSWLGDPTLPGDTLQILSVEEAYNIIQSLDWAIETHHNTNEKNAKISYLESAYLTEKTKSKKILDFVQLGYTVRQDLLPENRFNVGVGLQLPWKGSAKIGLNDLITKREITVKESFIIQEETKEKYDQLQTSFNIKVALYQQLIRVTGDEKTLLLQKTILDSGRLPPLKQMMIKEDDLKLQAKIKDLQSEIYLLYLDLLDTSGVLYTKPYINYLHPLMPVIL